MDMGQRQAIGIDDFDSHRGVAQRAMVEENGDQPWQCPCAKAGDVIRFAFEVQSSSRFGERT
jgi:hypothetical protein